MTSLSGALARAEDLSVHYGGVAAVTGVDIEVAAGEIVGLVGANGAGKTTVLDCLSGHSHPARAPWRLGGRQPVGRVYLDGAEVTRLAPDARARRGIVRSFQDARLFPTMSVWDTLLLCQDSHFTRWALPGLLGLPRRAAERSAERARVARAEELAARMGLDAHLDDLVGELSTGERRVLDLACCVGLAPRLLLLDEPSAGLSSAEATPLGPLLRRVRDETGAGVVMVEHDLPLVWDLADRIIILEQGRVVGVGRPDELRNHDAVAFGRLG